VKKVNKNRPALRENRPALLCIFSGQTARRPRHYTRNAPITKIGPAKVKPPHILQMVIDYENLLHHLV
jgi:hypothetical protein